MHIHKLIVYILDIYILGLTLFNKCVWYFDRNWQGKCKYRKVNILYYFLTFYLL